MRIKFAEVVRQLSETTISQIFDLRVKALAALAEVKATANKGCE